MKGIKKSKKILAVFLTVIMIAALTPLNVLAKQQIYKGNTRSIPKFYRGTELNKLPNIKSDRLKVKSKLDSKLLKLSGKQKKDSGKTKEGIIAEMKALKQIVPSGEYVKVAEKSAYSDVAHVYIKLKTAEGRKIVEPYTFKIVNEDKVNKLLSAWVDTNKLEQLEALDEVVKINTVVQPKTNVDKEGDELHRANIVRGLPNGPTGAGIKVGVISDGVDHLSDSIAKKALTSQITVLSNEVGGDEGTAMLEIVHALAPEAGLYFHDCGSDVMDFNQAIDELAAAGCNIIVDDISWITEPFFEDGIVANHVKQVIEKTGIIYTSSAGNFAQSHYSGLYYNDGSNNNDFSAGKDQKYKNMYVDIQPGQSVTIVLQWDDPFSSSNNDYDLFLRSDGRGNLASSEDKQQGDGSSPLEVIDYYNYTNSTIEARIDINNYKGAAAPKLLNLYIYGDNYLNNVVASNSIFGQAALPEVIAAGAIEVSSSNLIANYSSQGPVVHLNGQTRKKPDVCGAAGVSVTGVGGFPTTFSGTSAAAPHIAAIAALLWSKNSKMTNSEIRNLIANNSVDLGTKGCDDVFGYGRADAYNAYAAMDSTVVYKPAIGVALDRIQVNLKVGEVTNLTATVSPSDATNKNVIWSSNTPLIATVDSNGKITAVGKGTATIKATTIDGGYIASCNVTVIQPVTGVNLDKTQISLKVGEETKLSAAVSPSGASNKNIIWASNNPLIAAVDSNGKVTTAGKGTTTITVTTLDGGYTASCNITVTTETVRYGGASRFETAVQVSNAGWTTSENVVLVNAYGFADALAGVPFAYLKDAPILLTDANSIPKSTMDEITRLGAKNIYILGGTGVVSQNIENDLENKQYNVVRLAGTDRFDTGIKIGNEVMKNNTSKTAIVTTAYNYPDALSIGSYAAIQKYPILYTETNVLSTKTKEFIKNNGITKVIIPGGVGAVSEAAANELRSIGVIVERISGADRYETGLNIVNQFKSSFKNDVILATGSDFPDALAGGVLAAKKQIPILLVDKNYVSDGVKNYIKANGDINMYILGGTGVVPDSVIDFIKK